MCERLRDVGIPAGRLRPDDRGGAFSGPSRLRSPRRSAGPLRRDRRRRGLRSPDRGRDRGGVVGVRARHRPARAGGGAGVRHRDRGRRPLHRAQAGRPAERRVDARPSLHADRLSPRPRRLAQRSAVSRPRGPPRLQPARQPGAAGTLAADPASRGTRGVRGRRRAGPHRRRVGVAGGRARARGPGGAGGARG